jgi:hypothetical protein
MSRAKEACSTSNIEQTIVQALFVLRFHSKLRVGRSAFDVHPVFSHPFFHQPEKGHAENDGSTEGAGLQREQKRRQGHQQVGPREKGM